MCWDQTKASRQAAISLHQTLTSQRAMEHAAWGARKELGARIRALSNQPIRSETTGEGGRRSLQKKTLKSHDIPRSTSRGVPSGRGQKLSPTPKTRTVRATPTDCKFRNPGMMSL